MEVYIYLSFYFVIEFIKELGCGVILFILQMGVIPEGKVGG